MSETEQFPNPEQILNLYDQIEATATSIIKAGNAIGNPLMAKDYRDPRYAISVDTYIDPQSLLGLYLANTNMELANTDPGFVPNHPAHLHMTFSEIAHSEIGRKALFPNALGIRNYYKALVENYPDTLPTVCRMVKIMPTPDPAPNPEQPDKRPISIVAAFLPEDEEIYKVRGWLADAIRNAGLANLDLGTPRVFLVTLGRFKSPPIQEQTRIPLLETLERRNNESAGNLKFKIDKMEVISTATKYVFSSGHLFLEPPIPFAKDKRSLVEPQFVRPNLHAQNSVN